MKNKYEIPSYEEIKKAIGRRDIEKITGNREFVSPRQKFYVVLWVIVVILVGVILCQQLAQYQLSQSNERQYEWITMKK